MLSVVVEVSVNFVVSVLVEDEDEDEDEGDDDEEEVSKSWSVKGPAERHPSKAPSGFWVNPVFKETKKSDLYSK